MGRLLLLSFILLAFSNCEETRAKQCEKLREHLVDLRAAQTEGIDEAAHREALKEALGGDRFVASCASTLTDEELDCALRAQDQTAAAACRRAATN